MKFFISATTKGLKSYREEVAAHLRTLIPHDALEQSELPGDHNRVEDLLRSQMQGCDGVICLIGPAFGCSWASADPGGRPRSYTQLEFYLATKYFQKPTILFFAREDAKLDHFERETPEEELWQRQFISELRSEACGSGGRRYFEFGSVSEAIRQLDSCVRFVEQEEREMIVPRLHAYPLPLFQIWEDIQHCTSDRVKPYRDAASLMLAFMTSISVQAAARGGKAFLPVHTESRKHDWLFWRRALEAQGPPPAWLGNLPDWLASNREVLDSLEQTFERLSSDELNAEESKAMAAMARRSLGALMTSLGWLKDFALVGLRASGVNGVARARVLRSGFARHGHVELAPEFEAVDEELLYLFSLSTPEALRLWPALWCLPGEQGENQHQPVSVAELMDNEDGPSMCLRPLGPRGPDVVKVEFGHGELAWKHLPCSWLKADFLKPHVPQGVTGDRCALTGKLLSDEGWRRLVEWCLPEIERTKMLGGRFRVGSLLLDGPRASVFRVISDPTESSSAECCVAYLLPSSLSKDQRELAHIDLIRRHQCWIRLEHPAVLRPLPESQTVTRTSQPFLLVPLMENRVPLFEWLRGRFLQPGEIRALIRLAAEVCHDAHARGLRVLSLPLRHLLCRMDDPADSVFTGFDTLRQAECAEETAWEMAQRCAEDEVFAPELQNCRHRIPVTVDVYALGRFGQALLARSAHNDTLTSRDRELRDQLERLVLHCLWREPEGRFLSIKHVLMFLDQWVGRPADSPPLTAAVPAGGIRVNGVETQAPAFCIGRFPVTVAEYEQYRETCRNRSRPVRAPYPFDEDKVRKLGPWNPVTGVSLDDAEAFCRWMEAVDPEQRRWRLPTEMEWMRAAMAGKEQLYPWGDEPPDRSKANYDGNLGCVSIVGAYARASDAPCDMAGNVWEWCVDFIGSGAPLRVLKGGAYDYCAADLLVSSRRGVIRSHRSEHVGFRVLCEAP